MDYRHLTPRTYMASPRVFVSSTCYDLKYIRENLRYFITQIGYEPILSEEGSVFYDPKIHTHDACIAEVPNCQIFILIIGGRYGGTFKDSDKSITNAEFKKAVELKIPIFSLVEQNVYNEHLVYTKNRKNSEIDCSKIIYPSVDNVKIFDFIDEVRQASINNAITSFKDFGDLECYLRKQWAGMMFSFLTKTNEQERLADTLTLISSVNERVEMISRQILASVGNDQAKLTAELYDLIYSYECIRDLKFMGVKFSHTDLMKAEKYDDLLKKFNVRILTEIDCTDDGDEYSAWGSGKIGYLRHKTSAAKFLELKKELNDVLARHNTNADEYIQANDSTNNS